MEGNPEKIFKKGKEAITTSFTRWSKDYVSAAIYFDQAASLFKAQGNFAEVQSKGNWSVQRTHNRESKTSWQFRDCKSIRKHYRLQFFERERKHRRWKDSSVMRFVDQNVRFGKLSEFSFHDNGKTCDVVLSGHSKSQASWPKRLWYTRGSIFTRSSMKRQYSGKTTSCNLSDCSSPQMSTSELFRVWKTKSSS